MRILVIHSPFNIMYSIYIFSVKLKRDKIIAIKYTIKCLAINMMLKG